MPEAYAVIPEGSTSPVAHFARLEVAIDWGLRQYGSGGFRIRYARAAEPSDRHHTVPATS
jgi:hypothetical protein